MSELKTANLENFAKGAAAELFQRELDAVVANIDDINTPATVKREITLKFTIEPDDMRDEAVCYVEAKSKLAPVKFVKGSVYFGRRNGVLTPYSHNINQMEMNFQDGLEVVNKETGECSQNS